MRAALELIPAINALKAPAPLQTRISIATGLVVVGGLVGTGEAQERGIVGETPNLGLVRKQPLRAIGLMKQLCNSIRHGNRRA